MVCKAVSLRPSQEFDENMTEEDLARFQKAVVDAKSMVDVADAKAEKRWSV